LRIALQIEIGILGAVKMPEKFITAVEAI